MLILGRICRRNDRAVGFSTILVVCLLILLGLGLVFEGAEAETERTLRESLMLYTRWAWGQLQTLQVLLNEVLAADAKDNEARLLAGICAEATGNDRVALDHYRTLLQNAADRTELQILVGDYHLRRGEYEESEQAYRQVLKAYPESARAHFGLGVICQERGQDQQAARHYEKALKVAPDMAVAYIRLAYLQAGDGRYKEAAETLGKTVYLGFEAPETFYQLGVWYEAAGMLSEARHAYDRADQLQPGYQDARARAGRLKEQIEKQERTGPEIAE